MQNQNSIIYEVAKELGISKELVKNVINNFWLAVKYYMTNPLESRLGIRIKYFGVFEISKYRLLGYLTDRKYGKYFTYKMWREKFEEHLLIINKIFNEEEFKDDRFSTKWRWFKRWKSSRQIESRVDTKSK